MAQETLSFSLYSSSAKHVDFLLIVNGKIIQKFPMKKKGPLWSFSLSSPPEGGYYAFSVDKSPPLIDPYARIVLLDPLPCSPLPLAPKKFSWEGVTSPKIAQEDLIIYEMHVKGFTQSPSSKVKHPGTFLGIIEKIPYLQKLGINAVELMPLQEFDENDHLEDSHLTNYWGYAPINFFSIRRAYGTPDEFKLLVRELHKAGIALFLDVVYNHTGRPKSCFEKIDKKTYYILDGRSRHTNFTGCGNTFNANSPQSAQMLIEAMRMFVKEFHVDGFRFDLASTLTRGEKGAPLEKPPFIEMMIRDPILKKTTLIAEAWDPGGLYQVGSFHYGNRFSEWNGEFRDTVRRFIKGTGAQGAFASSISGSQDLYGAERSPLSSINFVTAHDGYTLRDLVTYQEKHNDANGEDNRDGTNNNESWNCGVEGPTNDPAIKALRARQIKNFFISLLTSIGTPMILMGDEYGHTKSGNNNTWCQDNELNYFHWDKLKTSSWLFDFVRNLIQIRKHYPHFRRTDFLTDEEVVWHGVDPNDVQWDDNNKFIAYTLKGDKWDLYIAYNAYHEDLDITLPESSGWIRLVDTNLPSPDDHKEGPVDPHYHMLPHSALILKCKSKR